VFSKGNKPFASPIVLLDIFTRRRVQRSDRAFIRCKEEEASERYERLRPGVTLDCTASELGIDIPRMECAREYPVLYETSGKFLVGEFGLAVARPGCAEFAVDRFRVGYIGFEGDVCFGKVVAP